MSTTDPQLIELSRHECVALLATQQVGRLGVNAEHYPLIFVVNYGVDDDVIVICTRPWHQTQQRQPCQRDLRG